MSALLPVKSIIQFVACTGLI